MNVLENLSVILAIPDLPSKTKLREALRNVIYKGEVQYSRSLKELEATLLEPATKVDMAFISGKYPSDDISHLLSSRNAASGRGSPAIIISLPSANAKSSAEIATWYLEGVAGFISEPYTAQDVANLLAKILEQRAKDPIDNDARSRKAFNFLLADAMKLVDEVARLNLDGKEGGYALRDLKGLSKKFGAHFVQDQKGYEDAIVEVFQKASPPSWGKGTERKKAKIKVARHPGLLVAEMITKKNIATDRLAELLAVDLPTVTALTLGQIPVNESLSQGLARIFGMTPKEWLRMQSDCDAYAAIKA